MSKMIVTQSAQSQKIMDLEVKLQTSKLENATTNQKVTDYQSRESTVKEALKQKEQECNVSKNLSQQTTL